MHVWVLVKIFIKIRMYFLATSDYKNPPGPSSWKDIQKETRNENKVVFILKLK